jgi:FADH2 O2-dependent halogenase
VSGSYDIAIVGSGFGGSLLAMIARRAGRSVVLIEKGTHPRFAVGESSTPLSNLLLDELSTLYDLPRLKPLTAWGPWQREYPQISCGLKRGFTFYHHSPGAPPTDFFHREQQLLVAASPNDAVSDTHWYRAEFDQFFLREAVEIGAEYFDCVALARMNESNEGVTIEGERLGAPVAFQCRLLLDATGPRGFVHRALGLREDSFPDFPQTQALYSHFSGVKEFGAKQPANSTELPPYPVDDAALHHVFDGGWIWILRFNNGLTSAGVAATDAVAADLRFDECGAAWNRLLELLPSVGEQFTTAKAELPFVHSRRLSFLTESAAGRRWAMLPSAAAFVDPLLSTGFPLTLFGVTRLGEIITNHWESRSLPDHLESYGAQTKKEAHAAAQLIGALYATMRDFRLFTSVSFLYFAAASFAETARRLRKNHLASSFLLCDDPIFGPAAARLCEQAAHARTSDESAAASTAILQAIEPFNVAGLGEVERRNWFPADPADMVHAAGKLDATPESILMMLKQHGFRSNA